MAKTYAYTGQDNLETMLDAVNYNRYQVEFILREIAEVKSGRKTKVLDVGAGIGTYADMLRQEGVQVDCVEPTARQAKVLRQKGYVVYKSIDDVIGKYDVVYALNVLEHLREDADLLAAMSGCLTRKGRVVIYVPAFQILFTKLDVLAGHFRRYRLKDMRRLALQTGLGLQRIQYCDPIGFFAALAYRIIGGPAKLNHRSVLIFDRVLFPISRALEPITQKLLGKNILAVYVKK